MSDVNTGSSSDLGGTVPLTSSVDAPMGMSYAMGPDTADVEKNKVFAIVAYIGILFIVPLLAAKDSRFAMYHCNQGLVLFLFGIAVGVIGVIPVLGWLVAAVGVVAELVFMIMGIIHAASGQMKPLPLIGGISILK